MGFASNSRVLIPPGCFAVACFRLFAFCFKLLITMCLGIRIGGVVCKLSTCGFQRHAAQVRCLWAAALVFGLRVMGFAVLRGKKQPSFHLTGVGLFASESCCQTILFQAKISNIATLYELPGNH